jgi:hypothetical protein
MHYSYVFYPRHPELAFPNIRAFWGPALFHVAFCPLVRNGPSAAAIEGPAFGSQGLGLHAQSLVSMSIFLHCAVPEASCLPAHHGAILSY